MSTPRGVQPTLAVYLDNLKIQLRLREVPGDRIGQILAEVEAHVADTGLDPVDAFGEPGEYAATYDAAGAASAWRASRRWVRVPILRLVVPATLAVGASIEGLQQITGTKQLAGTVDVTVRVVGFWLAVGVLALAFYRVSEAKAARDTARAFKSGKLISLYVVLVSLACLGAVAALVWVPEWLPTGPTLVSVPGLVLFVGGLLAGFALWRHARVSRVVDPRE